MITLGGLKVRSGRATHKPKPGLSVGADPKLFNLIYVLITGQVPQPSSTMQVMPGTSEVLIKHKGLDIWINDNCMQFFSFYLFGHGSKHDRDGIYQRVRRG